MSVVVCVLVSVLCVCVCVCVCLCLCWFGSVWFGLCCGVLLFCDVVLL